MRETRGQRTRNQYQDSVMPGEVHGTAQDVLSSPIRPQLVDKSFVRNLSPGVSNG